jgi:hypothetical protein
MPGTVLLSSGTFFVSVYFLVMTTFLSVPAFMSPYVRYVFVISTVFLSVATGTTYLRVSASTVANKIDKTSGVLSFQVPVVLYRYVFILDYLGSVS